MEPKGCEKILNRLSAIVDGEVSAVARLTFNAHLLVCPSCRRYADQFKAVKEAAGVVTAEDLPDDFEQVMGFVLDSIAEECSEG